MRECAPAIRIQSHAELWLLGGLTVLLAVAGGYFVSFSPSWLSIAFVPTDPTQMLCFLVTGMIVCAMLSNV